MTEAVAALFLTAAGVAVLVVALAALGPFLRTVDALAREEERWDDYYWGSGRRGRNRSAAPPDEAE